MEPYVSVIIPIYHPKREYIDRLMDSVARQTIGMEKMEVILVSDGDQSQETRAILSSWEERYPENILVIYYEENRRPGYARTLGMGYAKGKYIAFADQDDWLSLEMYRVLVEKAEECDCDIAGGFHTRDSDYERPEAMRRYTGQEDALWVVRDSDARRRFFREVRDGGYWCSIYRRDFLEKHRIYFPAGVAYDDNFFKGLCRHCVEKYLIVGEYFYHWFINDQSISMAENGQMHFDRLAVEELLLDELKERNIFYEFEREIEADFLSRYFFNSIHLFFSRLNFIPYAAYLEMCKKVRKEFPRYRENPYFSSAILAPPYPILLERCQRQGDEECLGLLLQVPERMKHFSWLDSVEGDMTENELLWFKCIYLLGLKFQ